MLVGQYDRPRVLSTSCDVSSRAGGDATPSLRHPPERGGTVCGRPVPRTPTVDSSRTGVRRRATRRADPAAGRPGATRGAPDPCGRLRRHRCRPAPTGPGPAGTAAGRRARCRSRGRRRPGARRAGGVARGGGGEGRGSRGAHHSPRRLPPGGEQRRTERDHDHARGHLHGVPVRDPGRDLCLELATLGGQVPCTRRDQGTAEAHLSDDPAHATQRPGRPVGLLLGSVPAASLRQRRADPAQRSRSRAIRRAVQTVPIPPISAR